MSKDKKITAIQWLMEQINEIYYLTEDAIVIFEKAKAMEREQIIDAHGDKMRKSAGTSNYLYWYHGEDYYNDTFKTKENGEI
jgi:hypothetical protein